MTFIPPRPDDNGCCPHCGQEMTLPAGFEALMALPRTPGEIARSIEIILSSVKLDRETARIMQSHLQHQRTLTAAQMAPYLTASRDRNTD